MGKRFIRQVLAQDEAVAVSTVVTYDLPVNPLSHILFTLKALNDTGTITAYSVIAALLAQVSQIEVLYKGQAIISGNLRDIWALNRRLTGFLGLQLNLEKTNNEVRGLTVRIGFGRMPFWAAECFPASRRGELQLRVTYAAAQTGIDGLVAQIETVELLEAAPERFLKYTTLTRTPAATGDSDADLPIGNRILGVLLFGTSFPAGTSYNASFGQTRLLVDNVEFGYSLANWETLHGEFLAVGGDERYIEHIHRNNQAVAGTEDNTGVQQESGHILENYGFLDYDPMQDLEYAIETEGHARVHLRINADVADAQRIIPVELITIGKG
jgi:hypothetical protein